MGRTAATPDSRVLVRHGALLLTMNGDEGETADKRPSHFYGDMTARADTVAISRE